RLFLFMSSAPQRDTVSPERTESNQVQGLSYNGADLHGGGFGGSPKCDSNDDDSSEILQEDTAGASMHFINTRVAPPPPPPPESRPTPFRRKGLDDDNDVDRVHSEEPSTGDLYTASSDVTFRTPLGSSWSPSDTSYLSIVSPVGSRERRDGGVSPPVQRVRIDSLVGGDPVDTNADAEEETWLHKVNSNSRRLFSRHNNKSAAEVKVMAARIDGLQREIRELRKELEESRTKILDMEERQEAFWQEDVYDIVNNISS
ncbi:hypothetical protein FOZ63_008798, partial [Perkinsus olseni]